MSGQVKVIGQPSTDGGLSRTPLIGEGTFFRPQIISETKRRSETGEHAFESSPDAPNSCLTPRSRVGQG